MHRFRWIAIAAAFALFGVLLAVALAKGADNADNIEREQQRRESVEQKLLDQEATSQALAEQLRQLGEQPVVEPEDPPAVGEIVVIPGLKGDTGDRGPSCIEEIGYPRCRGAEGEEGADGEPGEPGADSTTPGPPGEPGKDGRDGVDGQNGAPGVDGRGVKSLACEAGTVVVTYTDDTTQTVDGWSCLPPTPGNSGGPQ